MGKQEKSKRRRDESFYFVPRLSNELSMFPLMLASLANLRHHYAQTLLKKCLHKLQKTLEEALSNPPTTGHAVHSLLPVLLRTAGLPAIARRAAEIVGATALSSLEANETIASDGEIIEAWMEALEYRSERVSVAACNAVMDPSTTSFGRQRLCEIPALEKLMWEGFAHVAVCHWSQNQIQQLATPTPVGSMCSLLNTMSINLLHVGIQLIGSYDPVFRKACMISGISFPSLDCNKRTTFGYVIDKIDKEAGFTEAFKCVAGAIQAKNEDLFQWMRWCYVTFMRRKIHNM